MLFAKLLYPYKIVVGMPLIDKIIDQPYDLHPNFPPLNRLNASLYVLNDIILIFDILFKAQSDTKMSLFDTIFVNFIDIAAAFCYNDAVFNAGNKNKAGRYCMKEIKIENLYRMPYTAKVLNSLKSNWSEKDCYNFIGNKKKQHLLICFFNCGAVYYLKDGSRIVAPHDSIVYVPEESEYEIRFKDCDPNDIYNSISINFKLYDENGIPFCLDRNIKVYSLKHTSHILQNFNDIAEHYRYAIQSPMKVAGLFYLILSDIGNAYRTKTNILPKYNVIARGINTLESKCIYDIKISDLAKMCNVSPIYFRKLFKEYSGTTPVEYKLNTLIAQAKQHLLFSNKPVSEISEILGFSSPSYFCRIFRKKTGLTPTEYIKKELEP